jgi:hypothetical protein
MKKNYKATFKVIILLLLCASLNSCLSVDRKIKLNKDGSGEETMTISFMKEFYSMMSSMASIMDSARKEAFLDSLYSDDIFMNKTKSGYDSIPGIKISDIYSKRNPDSSNSFVIKYSFDSISSLGTSLDKAINEDNDSKISPATVTLTKEGDELVFDYIYEQPASEEMPENDSLASQMKSGMSEMFGNGFINFEIEFPYEIVSSNATSADQRTLKWYFPMSEVFLQSKMKLEARMKE